MRVACHRSSLAKSLSAFAKLALWLLRDARDPDRMVRRLDDWLLSFFEALCAPRGEEALRALIEYVSRVVDQERFEGFRAKMKRIPELEAHMVTMAEHWRAEGKAEGKAEGVRFSRMLLLKQLATKFGSVTDEHRERIERASTQELEGFAERLVDVDRIQDVFG